VEEPKLKLIKTNLRRCTFQSPKIKKWVESRSKGKVLNLFAGKTELDLDEIRNDIDETMNAHFHMGALDFVREWHGHKFDTIICDPPYCYDDKTEILTDEGWKLFKNLNRKEKVATLNPETGYLEYQKPLGYINENYKGEMTKIKSGYIDLLVTPNHQLYIKKIWHTNKFKLIEAKDVNFGCNFKTTCKWNGEEKKYFTLPGVSFDKPNRYGRIRANNKKIKMDVWLNFFGIWLAEGSADHKGTQYRVRIAQKNVIKREIIKQWIKDVGFHYLTDKKGFTIYNKQLNIYLRQFGYSKERFIPLELKQLSTRQLNILLDAMILGDGHRKKKRRWNKKYKKFYIDSHLNYTTYSKKLMDDISEIVIKSNRTPIIHEAKKKGYDDGYIINITNYRSTPKIIRKNIDNYFQKVNYDGRIYCIEVPNHIIYVKRGKRPLWCGNSYRKSMEMYNGNLNSRFKLIADNIPRILNKNGLIISFGYHSSFMGKVRGFSLKELCIFAHGGAQHCTIGIVECK